MPSGHIVFPSEIKLGWSGNEYYITWGWEPWPCFCVPTRRESNSMLPQAVLNKNGSLYLEFMP